MNSFKTPVLFITFNRPEHTRQVWEVIKKQRPRYVFVFKDGARVDNTEDVKKGNVIKAIFEESLDWNCEVKTYYSDKNLGCGKGPASAISWFFEHVEEGIIIEDDTIPALDFFAYAEELLEKYRNDSAIRAIGSMKVDNKIYGDGSYYFSMMNRTLCAFATWRRAWQDFDYYLRTTPHDVFLKTLSSYGLTLREREYWYERLLEIQKDALNETSWDQQFWMSIWLNNGKGIMPNANLSTNIGFDEFATHTTNAGNIAADIPVETILPLKHPTSHEIHRNADKRFQKLYFHSYEYGWNNVRRLPYRINKRVKRAFLKVGSWL